MTTRGAFDPEQPAARRAIEQRAISLLMPMRLRRQRRGLSHQQWPDMRGCGSRTLVSEKDPTRVVMAA